MSTRTPSRFRKNFARGGIVAALAAGVLVLTAVTPANAATTFNATAPTTVVKGNAVTAKTTFSAARNTRVSVAGICVRDAAHDWNYDYPVHWFPTINRWGTTFQDTKQFANGTYYAFSCLYYNGAWINVGKASTFKVGATTTPTPPVTTPPVTTPPVTTPPATDPNAIPTGDVVSDNKTWTPSFSEDFNKNAPLGSFGSTYGADWNGYSGFVDTSNVGTYAPDKVLSVANGNLDFYLHSENGKPLVAAPVPMGYSGQTYGRYSIRFKSDNIDGYKIAFLMWPSSDNWNEGEIDFPEGNLAGKMSPASAVAGTYSNGHMTFDPPTRVYTPTDTTGYHTATTEWSKGSVKWYWDGKLIGQTTNPAGVPTKPMRWTLQAETNTDGAPVPAASSGHIKVDWVEAYKLK
jgi:beta-glucanase (GH16 family)